MTATVTELPAATSQQVFRAVLDALARPGKIGLLPVPAGETRPAALLPLLALADLSTPVHVLSDDPLWTGVVTSATGAPAVALEDARLVAVLDPPDPARLRGLRTGSEFAPEEAAQLFVAVADLAEHGDLTLSGPGVPGSRELGVTGLPEGFWAVRAELVRGFPAGVDLVLVTADGRLAGVPRTTAVHNTAIHNTAIHNTGTQNTVEVR
ncbi:MAG TPA: phosphonate C-P lyase system protein PhnH [Pseudonocardiaceae bacterium]